MFGIPEEFHDRVADIVAQSPGVPHVVVQHPLHALGTAVAGGLRQGPAVLAFRLAEQSPQVGHHPPPRLHPPEPAREPRHEVTEYT
ncbi:hypothetical protein GCM10020227_25280 [Streptomyces flavovirens]